MNAILKSSSEGKTWRHKSRWLGDLAEALIGHVSSPCISWRGLTWVHLRHVFFFASWTVRIGEGGGGGGSSSEAVCTRSIHAKGSVYAHGSGIQWNVAHDIVYIRAHNPSHAHKKINALQPAPCSFFPQIKQFCCVARSACDWASTIIRFCVATF